jgi:hypothetical protein
MVLRIQDIHYIDMNQHRQVSAQATLMTQESAQQHPILRKVSFEDEHQHPSTSQTKGLQDQQQILSQLSFEESPCPSDSINLGSPQQEEKLFVSSSPVLLPVGLTSYWYSRNAKKLFQPLDTETPEVAVNDMIKILEKATAGSDPNHCLEIIKGNHYGHNLLDVNDLYKVRAKAVYLRDALKLARDTINQHKAFSFIRCCCEVVEATGDQLKPYDIKRANTLTAWFRDFRHGRAFFHAKTRVLLELCPLMQFFYQERDLRKLFKHQLISNLSQLSSRAAHDLFLRNMLPIASFKRGYTQAEGPQRIMTEFGLGRIQHIHFHHWLNLHGFRHVYSSETNSMVWTCCTMEE